MSDREKKITITELRSWGREQLKSIGIELGLTQDQVGLDVDLLLAEVLQVSREALIINGTNVLADQARARFYEFISRRTKAEPIAYILGKKEFFRLEFFLTPDVLIPRPETELIVERALKIIQETKKEFFLVDIGTGSGAIVLSILKELSDLKRCSAVGMDLSDKALSVAMKNAQMLGLQKYVSFIQGDLLSGVSLSADFPFTLIVSNPPYIAEDELLPRSVRDFEPRLALRAGPQGLDVIRRLVDQVFERFKEKFILLVEVGSTQADQVSSLLFKKGAQNIVWHKDLQGIDRIVEVRK